MSPTSYQAAPPRIPTISDEHASVKSVQSAGSWHNDFLNPAEGTTTRCRGCSRREKVYRNSNEYQSCPFPIALRLTLRYRTVAPSLLPPSWGLWEPCADTPPAPNLPRTAGRSVCPACNYRWPAA